MGKSAGMALVAMALAFAGCSSIVYGPEIAAAPGAAAEGYFVKEAVVRSTQSIAGIEDDDEECGLYLLDDGALAAALRRGLAGKERPLALNVKIKKEPRDGKTMDWTSWLCICTVGIFPGNIDPSLVTVDCTGETPKGSFSFTDSFRCDQYVSILPFGLIPGLCSSKGFVSPDVQELPVDARLADYLPGRILRAAKAHLNE